VRIWPRVCALLLFALPPRPSAAQEAAAAVYLVRSDLQDPAAVHLANLTRGELAADRVDVTVLDDERARSEPRATVVSLSARHTALVTVLLLVEGGSDAIDVWLANGATGYEAHREVKATEATEADRPAVLARRAADAVRALLWEGILESLRSAQAKATGSAAPSPSARPPHPVFALELGVAGFGNLDGLGMVFDPVVRVRLQLTEWLQLRAGGAGLGTGSSIGTENGSATLTQSVGLVDAVVPLWRSRALHPVVSGGVGVYDVRVQGFAASPYVAGQTDLVALAVDAGLGLSWRGSPSFEVTAEVHALLSEPIPRVRVAGSNSVTLGLPAVVATVTAASWL
jgi:hypothetical protein